MFLKPNNKGHSVNNSRNTGIIRIIVILVVTIIYLSYFISLILFKDEIKISPNLFITEFTKYIGTMTLGILTYLMVNIYISRRSQLSREYVIEKKVVDAGHEIGRLVVETTKALRDLFENKIKSVEEIELIIEDNLSNIKEKDSTIMNTLNSIEEIFPTTHHLRQFCDYRDTIHPKIKEILSVFEQYSLLQDRYNNGIDILDEIGILIHKLMKKHFNN